MRKRIKHHLRWNILDDISSPFESRDETLRDELSQFRHSAATATVLLSIWSSSRMCQWVIVLLVRSVSIGFPSIDLVMWNSYAFIHYASLEEGRPSRRTRSSHSSRSSSTSCFRTSERSDVSQSKINGSIFDLALPSSTERHHQRSLFVIVIVFFLFTTIVTSTQTAVD